MIYSGDATNAPTHVAKVFNVAEEPVPEPNNNVTVIIDGEGYPGEIVNGTITIDTNKTETELPSTVFVDGTVTVDTNATEIELPSSVIVDGKEYPAEVVDGKIVVKTNATEPVVKERLGTVITADDFTQYSCDYYAGERGGYFVGLLTDSNGNPLVNKTVKIAYNGFNFNRTTNETGHLACKSN